MSLSNSKSWRWDRYHLLEIKGLFIHLRERQQASVKEQEPGGAVDRGRGRSRLTPLQAGSLSWGSIPGPRDHGWSRIQTPNHPNHPGAPVNFGFPTASNCEPMLNFFGGFLFLYPVFFLPFLLFLGLFGPGYMLGLGSVFLPCSSFSVFSSRESQISIIRVGASVVAMVVWSQVSWHKSGCELIPSLCHRGASLCHRGAPITLRMAILCQRGLGSGVVSERAQDPQRRR